MPQEIKTIRLLLPYHSGSVNCYLIETDTALITCKSGIPEKKERIHSWLKPITSLLLTAWQPH